MALCDNSGEITDGHNNGCDLFVTSVRLRWYKETELNGMQLLRIKLINKNHIEKISQYCDISYDLVQILAHGKQCNSRCNALVLATH